MVESKSMGKSVIVTGGAGFLGSHLCEKLLNLGHEVICIDNFGSGEKQNIQYLLDNSQFTLHEQDIREPIGLPPVDWIFHLASRASPRDFTEYPVKIALTNTRGTRNILEHAVGCNARVLYASTSEIYGEPEIHPQPETYNGNVNIRGARGCYNESKRFGETLTVAYRQKFDIDVRTARIFNTYGPKMREDDGRVVPNFITQSLRGDPVTIFGDGSQTRCFCYVDDLIKGMIKFMEIEDLDGEVINIGNNNETSIYELAKIILRKSNSDSNIEYHNLPEDDPSRRRPDITKAIELLDWEPRINLEEGIELTIEYFQSDHDF